MERKKKDLLNMALDILVSIHAPAALSGANMNPVCCAIAGAGETFRVDKGFEQQGTDTIGVQPIVGELMGGQRKDFAGKVRNLNPGEDEKSAVVNNARKVALAGWIAPPDPMIARRNFQSGAGKEQAGDNPV
jgi:hypothetical protein